jgi:hypothetical protein
MEGNDASPCPLFFPNTPHHYAKFVQKLRIIKHKDLIMLSNAYRPYYIVNIYKLWKLCHD